MIGKVSLSCEVPFCLLWKSAVPHFVGWWFTAWAWCWHNCLKRREIFRRQKKNRRYGRDKMLPLLCRILKLRKMSAKHVLNNKGQKCVSVNTFLSAASKSYPFAKFFKTRLWRVYGYQQLSLAEYDFHTKNDQIYNYFQVQKDNTFTTQISSILGANCRYTVNLQNIVC